MVEACRFDATAKVRMEDWKLILAVTNMVDSPLNREERSGRDRSGTCLEQRWTPPQGH
jgi:hypothetical protein